MSCYFRLKFFFIVAHRNSQHTQHRAWIRFNLNGTYTQCVLTTTVYGEYVVCTDEKAAVAAASCSDSMIQRCVCAIYFIWETSNVPLNSCLSIQAPYVYVCLFASARSLSLMLRRQCVYVCTLCVWARVCVCEYISMDFDFILTTTLPDCYMSMFVSFHVELYVMRLMWDCDSFLLLFRFYFVLLLFIRFLHSIRF